MEHDMRRLIEKLMVATDCPLCGEATKGTLKQTKRTISFIRTHFCTEMNGNCKSEIKYKKEVKQIE